MAKHRVSMYAPVWERLKADGTVTVAAIPSLHARIVKAITKQKDQDLGFKVLNAERKLYATMIVERAQTTITFKLLVLSHKTSAKSSLLKL